MCLSKLDIKALVQARLFQITKSPTTYENSIPADIDNDGKDPITPRILESVHSETW